MIYWRGFFEGGEGKRKQLRVGLAMKYSIVREAGPVAMEMEHMHSRLMKARVPLKSQPPMTTFMVGYAPFENDSGHASEGVPTSLCSTPLCRYLPRNTSS